MWLASGAHHMFLQTLIESFSILPPGSTWSFHGWEVITNAAAAMFVLAVKLMAPVLLLLFFVYVALGLIARAVPQVQVFFVSFPLSVGLGLFILGLSLPAFMSLMHDAFVGLGQEHLKKAKFEITKLPKDKKGVFLSLSCAELVFERASKKTKNLRDPIVISPLSKQWALMKTSVFGL